MTEPVNPQLNEKELDGLREIHISINWKGFRKAWMKMFHDAPFELYQTAMRKVEGVSRKMMTGKASVLGMPVGIILRNTSRSMHNSADGKYFYSSRIVGFLGAVGAVVAGTIAGGPLLAAAAGASIMGVVGTWASYVVAGAVSAAVLSVPAYTAATLMSSTLVGAAVAAFSTVVAAPVNFLVGWRRSRAAAKGVKLTEDQIEALQTEFDRESPSVKYERTLYDTVTSGLRNLPENKQEEIYNSLKGKFDKSARKPAATKTPTAPTTQNAPQP